MNDEFHPDKYREEYRIRVLAMLDEKSKGREIMITPSPEPRYGQMIDLMQGGIERDRHYSLTAHSFQAHKAPPKKKRSTGVRGTDAI